MTKLLTPPLLIDFQEIKTQSHAILRIVWFLAYDVQDPTSIPLVEMFCALSVVTIVMTTNDLAKMMNHLVVKQPSEKLIDKLDNVVNHLQNCATLVGEAIALGKEEGFSEKEIGQMLRNRLKKLGYDPRSIRRALPPSVKDLSKTRKDILFKSRVSTKNEPHQDKKSSFESRIVTNENRQIVPNEIAKPLQDRIDVLEQQLNQKQIDYDDLLIRRNNLAAHVTQLMNQSHNVRTLILTREKFPLKFGKVFETHDYVFVVEFKGTEVLDISVMTQQQAHDQYKNEGVISGHG